MKVKDKRNYGVVLNLNSLFSIVRDVVEIDKDISIENFKKEYYKKHTIQVGDEFHKCEGTTEVRRLVKDSEKRTLKRKCINDVRQRLIRRRKTKRRAGIKYELQDDIYNDCKNMCLARGVPDILFDEIWDRACEEKRAEDIRRANRIMDKTEK